ncbi:MAG TPA: hypothetical protein VMF66_16105 [Candidatus Acidoferrum sp.]|nr:hypothetical protein [Candidatus Acidoferrum sp.]
MTNEASTTNVANERCLCREIVDRFEKVFDVPPAVRQHLTNSRVEFLKAVRAALDQRIEHLSQAGRHGSHIAVE